MIKKAIIVAALGMTAAVSAHAQAILAAETNIEKGAYIASRSGIFTLVVQNDGNAVMYFNTPMGTRPAGFSTNTSNGERLRMQMDGNLALYKSNGTWAWNAGTGGRPYNMGYKLVLFETGRLAILDANNNTVKELARVYPGSQNGGPITRFPFRKTGIGGCTNEFTPPFQSAYEAVQWATANGGSVGYCNAPF